MIRFPLETHSKHFSSFPFIYLSAAFISGIIAAELFSFSKFFALYSTFLLLALTISAGFRNRNSLATAFVLAAFSFGGAFIHLSAAQDVPPNNLPSFFDRGVLKSGQSVVVEGVLRREPEMSVDGWFIEIAVEKFFDEKENEFAAVGNVRIFIAAADETAKQTWETKNLSYAARVRCAARLGRESSFQNPGSASFAAILAQKNLSAVGTSLSPDSIAILDENARFSPIKFLYDWRQKLISSILRNFSLDTAGVLIASLLGNDNFLSKQSAEKFRIGGTFHLLVISGTHITFIGILMIGLLRKVTKKALWQFLGALLVLWSYTFAVGAEIPVVRAALMFSVYQSARLFYRSENSLNALGAAVFALAAWRTADVFSPSFQLTVCAVAAIVMFCFPLLEKLRAVGDWQLSQETPFPPNVSPRLKNFAEILFYDEINARRLAKRNSWQANFFRSETARKIALNGLQSVLRFLFSGLFISASTTIFLAPLLIIYFHRISLAGLFLNFFVAVTLAFETFTAILTLLVAEISPILAAPFAFLTEILNRLLTESVEPFRLFSWFSPRIPTYTHFGKIFYVTYYLPLVALLIAVLRWNPFAQTRPHERRNLLFNSLNFLALALLFGVIFFHPLSAEKNLGKLTIDFLDVGQGDTALITFPDDTKILVDGGGKPVFRRVKNIGETSFEADSRSIGEAVVAPFLWSKGLSEVDYVLATHADSDHIEGLSDIILNFSVKGALTARENVKDADFQRFTDALRQKKTPLQVISKGEIFRFGGAEMQVISPNSDDSLNQSYGNDESIVIIIKYGRHSFLLTGDIERQAETELVSEGILSKVDVVKIPHHGSRTSSTADFVQTTKPTFGIISVGKTSPYGHPHKEVVERWQNAGTKIFTTGENGAITFLTDGETLSLQTFSNTKELLLSDMYFFTLLEIRELLGIIERLWEKSFIWRVCRLFYCLS